MPGKGMETGSEKGKRIGWERGDLHLNGRPTVPRGANGQTVQKKRIGGNHNRNCCATHLKKPGGGRQRNSAQTNRPQKTEKSRRGVPSKRDDCMEGKDRFREKRLERKRDKEWIRALQPGMDQKSRLLLSGTSPSNVYSTQRRKRQREGKIGKAPRWGRKSKERHEDHPKHVTSRISRDEYVADEVRSHRNRT